MILMNESVTIGPWSGMIMHHMFMQPELRMGTM